VALKAVEFDIRLSMKNFLNKKMYICKICYENVIGLYLKVKTVAQKCTYEHWSQLYFLESVYLKCTYFFNKLKINLSKLGNITNQFDSKYKLNCKTNRDG